MRLVERKSVLSTLQVVVNLAVLGAVLSQVASPILVKANSSQKTAKNEVISQGKLLPMVKIPFAGNLVKKDLPDKVIKAVITAYTSTPGQTDDTPFITANGTRVRWGIVASNLFPFNSRVRIKSEFGDEIFIVTDRMHPRFSNRIDIWFPTREEALAFGKQRILVEVWRY